MKRKPVVGDILYDLNTGNAARDKEQVLTPVIVCSVGRKYFQCNPFGREWDKTSYHIDTWLEKTDYSSRHKLYESQQERREELEAKKLYEKLRPAFSLFVPQIPLAKLKAIEAILAD